MTEKLIVLRVIPHGEADLIVHGLNPLGAKMVFYARSAMKSKKRFGGGVLEPTHYIQALYRPSRQGSDAMAQLQEASILEDFSGLRQDYERLQLALHFVYLVDRMSKEGMVHSEGVFHLLGNTLRSLEKSQSLSLLKLHFELKLLALQGELPFIEGAEDLLQASVKEHEQVKLQPDVFQHINTAVAELLLQY